MPDLRSTVQKMVAAGESEEDIAAVIKKLSSSSEIKSGLPDMSPELETPRPMDTSGEADTFAGGVLKSLGSGEAFKAGWEGFKGNLESIKDIPANLAYGAKDLLDFHLNPGQTALRMGESLKQIPDIVKNAGADPRTFGRTVGAFTTAPLVTEGLGAGILRGPGAINRIPRVNKTLSSLGNKLEGTRSPIIPQTPRGLVAGAVRGVARPIGRALSRAGERGRLAGGTAPPNPKTNIKLKDETPDEAASRNSPNKPPNEKVYAGGGQGITRPRPVRYDTPDLSRNSEFTRPIVEDLNTRAGRDVPNRFPRNIDASEADPMFRSDLETAGDLATRGPKTPTPAYDSPVTEIDPMFRSDPTVLPEPPKPGFEPSVDPAKNFSFEDLQMMKTRRDEVNAILRKMAEENDVDPTTGEISPGQIDRTFPGIEQPKRTQGKWGITRPDEGAKFADNVNEEMGYFGGEQNSGMIDDAGIPDAPQRYPGDEAFDLGEISPGFRDTPSMPNWGLETVPTKRPVNPLRPEVPPGQVSNRRMFELSEQRAAEMKAAEAQQFNDSVAPHEFDQDMMLTPDEMTQPDVPKFTSPFENPSDPRTSGLPPRSDTPEARTIQPEELGDWGGLEADIPTLVPDASGSHVAAPNDLVHKPKPRMPDEILGPAEFEPGDLNNPNFGRFDAHPTQVESSRFNNPGYRAETAKLWGDLTQSEIKRHIELQSVMNGPLEQITPQLHQEYTALNNRRPGPKQPDQYLMKQAAEQRRLENIKQKQLPASQFSARANEEAGSFNVDNDPGIANDNPFEGMTDKRGFSSKASDVKNRLLEHPEGPAGERGKEVLRYTQSKVANTLKGSIPDSLAEYHTFAEANPDYVAQVTPLMVKRVAAELRGGHARGLKVGGADNIPGQRAHTEAIAEHFNQLADDLEANPTPENIYRIKDEVGAFESDRNLGPRFGRSDDSPRLVNKAGKVVKETKPAAKAELIDQRVTDPSGKHLGDIVITEERIKTLQKHPAFKDMTREQVIEQLHGAQLETILEKAKIPENARTRVKVEPIDYNTNKTIPQETPESTEVGEFGAESLTDFSGTTGPPVKTKPSAFKTSTRVEINPDRDFGPGGDIGPITQELRRLISDQAVDTKYRSLLPKIMREGELQAGQTYRGKLERLIKEIIEEQQMSPEAGAQRLKEMDAFTESMRNATGVEKLSDIPLLPKFSKIDRSKLQPSTLTRPQQPWISPRIQQQFPDIARKRKK